MNEVKGLRTVNYHFLEECNFRCGPCFAGHGLEGRRLSATDALKVVDAVATAGCEKLNFVGGEPTLCSSLGMLIKQAKSRGLTTSIVTNGTGLTNEFLRNMQGYLDWIGISIDSLDAQSLKLLGRYCGNMTIDRNFYLAKVKKIKAFGYRLKINTVVSSINFSEDMSDFINYAKPERWKVFQVLSIGKKSCGFSVASSDFHKFCKLHQGRCSPDVNMVAESDEQMRGSYSMIDPLGRFYDNVGESYRYSSPILEVGVKHAYESIVVDVEKMVERGAFYKW